MFCPNCPALLALVPTDQPNVLRAMDIRPDGYPSDRPHVCRPPA